MMEYELFLQRQRELEHRAGTERLAREAARAGAPRAGRVRRFARSLRHAAPAAAPLRTAGPAGC
ncbi:hypothetical protein [Kitasatospora sp. DSM 101779]|uniref:hypothetical protein n=1 Tax=Kitasatospora sp. DSM 101779 TaxID=2853165 RepID=UPI0021D9B7A8|nr:hypothetical protein [Kitasatospora sp. DSM 101779]MCU7822735.1 hypothetical protein [Kitasatospora sp. DSM 101779]